MKKSFQKFVGSFWEIKNKQNNSIIPKAVFIFETWIEQKGFIHFEKLFKFQLVFWWSESFLKALKSLKCFFFTVKTKKKNFAFLEKIPFKRIKPHFPTSILESLLWFWLIKLRYKKIIAQKILWAKENKKKRKRQTTTRFPSFYLLEREQKCKHKSSTN